MYVCIFYCKKIRPFEHRRCLFGSLRCADNLLSFIYQFSSLIRLNMYMGIFSIIILSCSETPRITLCLVNMSARWLVWLNIIEKLHDSKLIDIIIMHTNKVIISVIYELHHQVICIYSTEYAPIIILHLQTVVSWSDRIMRCQMIL